ncbi:MAG TPA: phage scaffolding protein [Clostridiales bacterium]|nr:phage scaffolding protein [Clostridiales bacterium]
MKREDLEKIVDGITKEQVSQILDLNSADIGKAKGDFDTQKAALEKAQGDLKTANETIKTLEAAKGDTTKLNDEIAKYKKQIEDRDAAEAAAKAESEMTARLEKALGEKKFASEFARDGVLLRFKAALNDEAYKGKGDADILSALTKDKDGVFATQNPKGNMGSTGNADGDKLTESEMAAMRSAMGLNDKKS